MFVKKNTLKEIKLYFKSKLSTLYSDNEIKSIVKELTIQRFEINTIEYISFSVTRLSESDLLFYRDAVKRLENEEPFQYILGDIWFYDLNLKIDSRALIPRPETEELVDWVATDFKEFFQPIVMDLCSGSGCIAFALKSVLSTSQVIAAEYMDEALELIEENGRRTDLDVKIESMDVLNYEDFKRFQIESFDCWVSNPPYILNSEKALMAPNVLEHEPEISLFVDDEDPLIFYRVIAENAMIYLRDEGVLYYEINERLADEMTQLLEEIGFVNIEVRKDLQGKDRMMKALKVSSRHESK